MKEQPSVFDEVLALAELRDLLLRADASSQAARAKAFALNNSRPLFMHRWSRTPNFRAFADVVYDRLFPEGHPRHHRWSWRRQLRILLADLYHCFHCDPEAYIGVSLNKNSYRSGSRYLRQTLTHWIARQILQRLREEGLLIWHNGYFDKKSGEGRKTRIKASQDLIDMFAEFSVGIADITALPRELIVLRNKDEEDIEYEDNELTNAMRAELTAYNDFLQSIDISLELTDFDNQVKVDLSAKSLHRVFNNETWCEGGRFYGGWWITAKDQEDHLRQRILINHKPTREIDYSGMHIALAYARKGIDYWGPEDDPLKDPYFTDLLPAGLTPTEARDTCKSVLLNAINAPSKSAALKAVNHDWYKKGEYDLMRRASGQLPQLLQEMIDKHPLIEEFIGSGLGVTLQNEDARIAERVIRQFMKEGRPVLSIHDSFVVEETDAEFLQKTMDEAFKAHVLAEHGVEVNVRYKQKYFYSTKSISPDIADYVTDDDLHQLLEQRDIDEQERVMLGSVRGLGHLAMWD